MSLKTGRRASARPEVARNQCWERKRSGRQLQVLEVHDDDTATVEIVRTGEHRRLDVKTLHADYRHVGEAQGGSNA